MIKKFGNIVEPNESFILQFQMSINFLIPMILDVKAKLEETDLLSSHFLVKLFIKSFNVINKLQNSYRTGKLNSICGYFFFITSYKKQIFFIIGGVCKALINSNFLSNIYVFLKEFKCSPQICYSCVTFLSNFLINNGMDIYYFQNIQE